MLLRAAPSCVVFAMKKPPDAQRHPGASYLRFRLDLAAAALVLRIVVPLALAAILATAAAAFVLFLGTVFVVVSTAAASTAFSVLVGMAAASAATTLPPAGQSLAHEFQEAFDVLRRRKIVRAGEDVDSTIGEGLGIVRIDGSDQDRIHVLFGEPSERGFCSREFEQSFVLGLHGSEIERVQ